MKAIWKGSISFGLVNIPIQLFSAVQEHILGFKLLCKKCNSPIKYQRWCEHCKKKIEWQDVVKGLEVSKDKYVILTQDKIKELKPKAMSIIDITEFVQISLIRPIYYKNHYYVLPVESDKAKAYVLLRDVLASIDKAAIGKFVMHDKEHVCVLQAYENALLLSTLNYEYEIRSIAKLSQLPLKKIKATVAELKLAKELINKLSVKKFDISHFKDTFAQEILKLIKNSKVRTKASTRNKKNDKSKTSLHDALRESLHETRV